jgi:tryptophan halogenase
MTKFVILGGGTAGWITAISMQKLLPQASITLIQSKEIGIIGVGEATTPHLVNWLRDHDIDPLDMIRVTKGTIKNGISFENWNGDNSKYFHDFTESMSSTNIGTFTNRDFNHYFQAFLINKNLNFEDYMYQIKLASNNKVDLKNTKYALHFDSVKFADYLEDIGKSRGVQAIDDIFLEPVLDHNGFIKSLKLQSEKIIDCDFVFDCTGFSRLLIGKLYKSKWQSYSKFLPAKKAIPFWLENKDDVAPYTSSIAMKNGWMWNIPLQHRIGAGYVFDSDYISVDQAKQEAEEYLGHEIDIRKIISFDPGRYDEAWIKNCLAVGLSANFLEPLESTSLWLALMQLNNFKSYINEIFDPSAESQKAYNKMVTEGTDLCADFVHFHYLTKRNDSLFWREFREKNKTPDHLKEFIHRIEYANLRPLDVENVFAICHFPLYSFLLVAHGLDMFKQKFKLAFYEDIFQSLDLYKKILNDMHSEAPYHKDLLQHLQRGPV